MLSLRKMCLEHGFRGSKGRYFRCIGDGVLQGIFELEKIYIDPYSPEYSDDHRKDKYITIGLWSLYSELPEEIFNGEIRGGQFEVASIAYQGIGTGPFMGNQYERNLLATRGLPMLDQIQTQSQLADTVVYFANKEHNGLFPDQINLFGAFLRCERCNEALDRVQAFFTLIWMPSLHKIGKEYSIEEIKQIFTENEHRLLASRELAKLWGITMRFDPSVRKDYTDRNYAENIERVKRANIPILESV